MASKQVLSTNAVITKVLPFALFRTQLGTPLEDLPLSSGTNRTASKQMIHVHLFFLLTIRKNINARIKVIAFVAIQAMELHLEVATISL